MKRAHNYKDLTGQKFQGLTAIRDTGERYRGKVPIWLCRCDCGNLVKVQKANLSHQKSCGCAQRGPLRHGHTVGGHSKTFKAWSHMRGRCNNPNDSRFKWYGGIGIKVCKRWESFDNFLADMGEAPVDKSLDRINPFMDYEPSNCIWSGLREQRLNTRRGWIKRGFKPTDRISPSYWEAVALTS